MKNFVSCYFLLVTFFTLSACAITPQKMTLQPELDIKRTNVGGGTIVAVNVVDERPEEALGYRGTGVATGAEIITLQDVSRVIYSEVEEGLKKYGFKPVPLSSDSTRILRIDLRLLEYSTSVSLLTMILHGKAMVKVVAINNGKSYENIYRVHNEKHYVIVPFAGENEEVINKALSDVLQKIFKDKDLFALLAE